MSGSYQEVAGERAAPVIAQALSLQTRLSNYIAFALIAIVAVGLLLWYYGRAAAPLASQVRAQQHPAAKGAADDVMLPSIGPIRVPLAATTAVDESAGRGDGADRSAAADASTLVAAPAQLALTKAVGLGAGSAMDPAARPPAVESSFQRRLSGEAFLPANAASTAAAGMNSTDPSPDLRAVAPAPAPAPEARSTGARGEADALTSLLSHASAPIETATVLPTRTLMLPKGTFIDCTLETAIDSTLPGMTTCITATDTFGADGKVVLLERGTRLIGETRGQVQQGAARVFVLWSEARTPAGVLVPLDAPGTDELGRSGLSGQVERHFWQRFGAAVLLSVIDGAVQAGVQASAADRGGTVIYNPGGAQDVMSEILKGTVSIPPTVRKSNGDRIQVFVARDVDFRAVYELQPIGSSR